MERLKKLSKPELIKVIDLLMRHNLNNKHFLTRVLNELEYEKENQLINEEQAAFERYIKLRTRVQNLALMYVQAESRCEAERIITEIRSLEPKVEAAFAEYERLNKRLQGMMLNERLEYIAHFDKWLSAEPPMFRLIARHKWKRQRPV